MQHNTNAVLALATGRADQFLAEAQLATVHNSPSCPLSAALSAVRNSIAPVRSQQEQFEVMTARQQEALARMEASRARMEVRLARVRMANFNPVVVRAPRVVCPRVNVRIPRIPTIKMPALQVPSIPVVQVEYSEAGPV